MSIPIPVEYIDNESGKIITVTLATKGMSLIGPDYFDLGELTQGDYIVDFPDGSTRILNKAELDASFTRKPFFGHWTSIDSAKSFVREMQYAIDHPEEHELSPKEITEAKAYIHLARNYIAERDESL